MNLLGYMNFTPVLLIPLPISSQIVCLDLHLHCFFICLVWHALQALEQFRKQEVDFLIATDVAARVSNLVKCFEGTFIEKVHVLLKSSMLACICHQQYVCHFFFFCVTLFY